MKVEPFQMERMQSEWENRVAHNLSESGVHPMTVGELLDPSDREEIFGERLLYVQSNGSEALRTAVAALYPGADARNVVVTNGTAEANYISIWKLVEPGDEVVMMLPNYMQIWGAVRGQGATVVPWKLREEQAWAPDVDELSRILTPRTRLVVVCNPNNPQGSVLTQDAMREIVDRTARHGAWLLVDEVYRGAEREGEETPTFWGTYDRLLVTCGLSKAYALPGLRIGLGGGAGPDHRRAVGAQGLPDHQPRRALRRPRAQGPCVPTSAPGSWRAPAASCGRTIRCWATGSPDTAMSCGWSRPGRAPSPTRATRGPSTPRSS
jgi:aspartate/methionine/tyrosine aminotransferase